MKDFWQHVTKKKGPQPWKVREYYKGQWVNIPGDKKSEIFPVKYFKVIGKKRKSPTNLRNEDEVSLTLWAGWRDFDPHSGSYDHEVEINLFIAGDDATNTKNYKVGAEILKTGSATMEVYFNNKKITIFKDIRRFTLSHSPYTWYGCTDVDKHWEPNMRIYLTPT